MQALCPSPTSYSFNIDTRENILTYLTSHSSIFSPFSSLPSSHGTHVRHFPCGRKPFSHAFNVYTLSDHFRRCVSVHLHSSSASLVLLACHSHMAEATFSFIDHIQNRMLCVSVGTCVRSTGHSVGYRNRNRI